jgi:hypothetical protein
MHQRTVVQYLLNAFGSAHIGNMEQMLNFT